MNDTLTAISNIIKDKFLLVMGITASFTINMLGGWGQDIQTLLIFMTLDYLLGMANTVVFKTSPKTENGRLSSKQGMIGICKKLMLLSMVVVGNRIDLTFGLDYVRGGICVALIVNEIVSMIETWKLSGLKTPEALADIVDILSNKDKKQ